MKINLNWNKIGKMCFNIFQICKCEDNKLRRSECARAYLDDDCTNCRALFTTMKPTKNWNQFPERWSSSVNTLVLKEGCDVSLKTAGYGKIRSFSSTTERIIKVSLSESKISILSSHKFLNVQQLF